MCSLIHKEILVHVCIIGNYIVYPVLTLDSITDPLDIREVREKVSVKIQGFHRLEREWKYDEYFVHAQLFHGSRCLGQPGYSHTRKVSEGTTLYPKVTFNGW